MYRLHSILLVDLTAILFEETRSTRYQPSSPLRGYRQLSPNRFFLFEFDIAMRFSVTKTARNGPDRIGGEVGQGGGGRRREMTVRIEWKS